MYAEIEVMMMDIDIRGALAQRAFAVVPGAGYNQYRRELAEQAATARAVIYEAALPAEAPLRALSERVMPQFARYLQAKDLDPEAPRGVVACVFFLDLCYALHGEELVRLFCELEGLNRDALHFRVLRWLTEHQG